MLVKLQMVLFFILTLSFLSCGHKNEQFKENAFSISNSDAGIKCQDELRKSGVIKKDQGFALYSDGQDVSSKNLNDKYTYSMTVSEFKSYCAEIELYP